MYLHFNISGNISSDLSLIYQLIPTQSFRCEVTVRSACDPRLQEAPPEIRQNATGVGHGIFGKLGLLGSRKVFSSNEIR